MKKPSSNIANQEGISLRQSYSRVTPQLLRQASNRKSPQQKKKALELEANTIIDLRYYLFNDS